MKSYPLASLLLLLALPACGSADSSTFVGFVDAPISAVATEVAGQVASVEVREGDLVKKGQVLARLDAREREASVAVAQANVDRAHTAEKEAEENLHATAPTVRGAGADVSRAKSSSRRARRRPSSSRS